MMRCHYTPAQCTAQQLAAPFSSTLFSSFCIDAQDTPFHTLLPPENSSRQVLWKQHAAGVGAASNHVTLMPASVHDESIINATREGATNQLSAQNKPRHSSCCRVAQYSSVLARSHAPAIAFTTAGSGSTARTAPATCSAAPWHQQRAEASALRRGAEQGAARAKACTAAAQVCGAALSCT